MLHLHRRPVPPASFAEIASSSESLLSNAIQLAREALTLDEVQRPNRLNKVDTEAAAWAVLGAAEQDPVTPHTAVLERLFAAQRADGELPAAVNHIAGVRFKAWWRRAARKAVAAIREEGELVSCKRRQALLVWACAEMAVRTGDTEACRRWRAPLEAAIAWLDRQPCAPRLDVGLEAFVHQARMALGHLSILLGDAVTGARHWAAAAAAKARIETVAAAKLPETEHLWALVVGAEAPAACPLAPGGGGLAAWAAAQAGDLENARQLLLEAAREALTHGKFENSVSAGLFLRGVACWRGLGEKRAGVAVPMARRQWELSEDEARILTVC